ncbi:MAG: hypothetical protein U9N45_04440, partial [Gemmatimonadota bacterium]|nr:hypothetical protein [Gemmatimonadota bacterium]
YISFSGRPRGVRYIRLRSSSDYALGALSATVSVTVTSAPEVAIISPTDGSSVGTGVPVLFLARAMDSEEGALAGNSVAWSSSLDGNFAAGAFVLYDRLSRGTHLIAITARNSTGGMASDTVSLTVEDGGNRAPLLTVTAPGDGSSFNRSQQVLFLATGTDPEDGPLPEDRFYWLSDADGLFGSGPALECNGLGLGGHVIVVVGADEAGAAGADSISLDIVASGANTPPEATIITPVDGTEFAAGTAVLLQGSATDAEQGGLIGAEGLSWSSSLDGELGDGAAWLAEGLSTGVHRIFLTALDAQGAAGRDSVAVSFTASGGNRAPEVRIVSPPDSSAFALGQTVAFQAEVSDPEEGALEDTAIRWSSDIGGSLGEGAGFATDRLSGGVHRITLLAVDSRGAAGRDSVRVGISGPPEVSISSPVHGESYPIGAPLEFTGSAIDPEEGALGPEALTWWYSPLGESRQIGEGNSFVTRELGFGVHRITLIAEDGMGVKDSASVTISMVSMPDSVLASISVGSRPLHVALDNTGGTAYVTNSGGSSVSVVSLETFQETNRIGVGENPAGVGFSPGMARVYVANSSENNISVIRDNSVEQTIPVGFQPSGVAVGPDETMVFVANSNAASLSVVGAAEGTVVRTISDVGNSPGSMLIPPGARELLFVSNYGSREQGESGRDEVAAVQWTASSITRIPVGDKPLGLAATSDGALVFVANSGSGSVSVIDADALSVVSEIAVGLNPSSCAVTPDNNQLYVVNSGSRSISVIDIQSKVIIETVGEFGLDPYDIAVYEAPEAEPRVLMLVTDRGADRLKVLLVR